MAYVSTWSLTMVFGYASLGLGGILYCNQTPFSLREGGVWVRDYDIWGNVLDQLLLTIYHEVHTMKYNAPYLILSDAGMNLSDGSPSPAVYRVSWP